MSLTLRIDSGPRAKTTFTLVAGAALRVGRLPDAEVSLPDDQFISGLHLELAFDGQSCKLTDLNSRNGTLFNGARITEAILRPGDRFTAGQTTFTLIEEPHCNPTSPESQSGSLADDARVSLLHQMRTNLQPLYAVLDSARDPRMLAILAQHKSDYLPLFGGSSSPELRPFAPYLVALPADSSVLETLVGVGWGQNWGVFLTSIANGSELHGALCRQLIAYSPDKHQILLRFYDPRVLRTLFAEPSEQQCAAFFSHVRSYFMEGERPNTAVGFIRSDLDVERVDIRLAHHCTITRTPISITASRGIGNGEVTLSTSQMKQFKAQECDARTDRLEQAVRREYPQQEFCEDEEELKELVLYGCTHSQRYGMRSDKDVTDYISLMNRLGRNFDQDAGLPWASDLLNRRIAPGEKLFRLKEMACKVDT